MVVAAPRREKWQGPRRIPKAFKPIVVVFAALYFLIDAIFFSLIRPLGTWLSKLPIFRRIGSWIRPLGPYPTLALFAVPLIVLEPVKPVGLYLIAFGNVSSDEPGLRLFPFPGRDAVFLILQHALLWTY